MSLIFLKSSKDFTPFSTIALAATGPIPFTLVNNDIAIDVCNSEKLLEIFEAILYFYFHILKSQNAKRAIRNDIR